MATIFTKIQCIRRLAYIHLEQIMVHTSLIITLGCCIDAAYTLGKTSEIRCMRLERQKEFLRSVKRSNEATGALYEVLVSDEKEACKVLKELERRKKMNVK
jgi:hypothetical protein